MRRERLPQARRADRSGNAQLGSGVVLAALLNAGPAMAQGPEAQPTTPDHEHALHIPPVSRETRETLKDIADSLPDDGAFRVVFEERDLETGNDIAHQLDLVTRAELRDRKPFVTEGTAMKIEFLHSVPLTDEAIRSMTIFPDLFDALKRYEDTGERTIIWDYKQLDTDNDGTVDEYAATALTSDRFHNEIMLTRRWHHGDTSTGETVLITPLQRFAEPGQPAEVLPIPIDLSHIGYGVLENGFYMRELESIAVIDGVPVYAERGSSEREFRESVAPYTESFHAGMRDAAQMFGFEHLPVEKIVIVDADQQNAFAYPNYVMRVTDDLLHPEKQGQTELSGEDIRTVAAHESFHFIDKRLLIGEARELQDLYASTTPDVLQQWNESVFMGHFGGHAQDNRAELFASLCNTLRDPAWEQHVNQMTPDARKQYAAALVVLQEVLQTRTQDNEVLEYLHTARMITADAQRDLPFEPIQPTAPIFTLLGERVGTLKKFEESPK